MEYAYDWEKAFEVARKGERKLLDEHIDHVYRLFLYPFIRIKTRTSDDAYEICAEVVGKFWDKFYVKKTPLPNNVNGYLNAMARNAVLHFYTMKEREKKTSADLDDTLLRKIAGGDLGGTSHQEMKAKHEEKELLYQALELAFKKLGDKCSQLLRMNIFEKIRIKEITKTMGFPTPNATTQKKKSCFKQLKNLVYTEIHHLKN